MNSSMSFLIGISKDVGDNQCDGSSGKVPNINIHFNLWDVSLEQDWWSDFFSEDRKTTFLDVGVKISDITSVGEFVIFLPFMVRLNDIVDLHKCLSTNSELARTIFNEDLSFACVTHNESYISFGHDKDEKNFFMHSIPLSNDKMVTIENKNYQYNGSGIDSTLITLTKCFFECANETHKRLKDKSCKGDCNSAYFRLRIPLKNRSVFFTSYKPKDAFFTGNFQKSEIVDFRVNDLRSLPAELYAEKNARSLSFCSSRVDYFLIKDASAELQTVHAGMKKARTLEKAFWNDYILFGNDDDGFKKTIQGKGTMVIYHWVKDVGDKDDIVSFSAFAKFCEAAANKVTIICYLFIVIAISILSNVISDKL